MKRMPGLIIVIVLIVATSSFIFFNFMQGVGQQAASPNVSAPTPNPSRPAAPSTPDPRTPIATPLPPPVFTPWYTPLPPPSPAPTATPQSTSIPPTPIQPSPATPTSWLTYQSPSGFSFSYLSGWDVQEVPLITIPGYSPDPQISISVANFKFLKPTGRGGLPLGGFKIDITDHRSSFPLGGTRITVGPQQFPGQLFVYERPNFEGTQSLERMISIYFTAGTRQWVIVGYFAPPTTHADRNTSLFYQMVGSLRYEQK